MRKALAGAILLLGLAVSSPHPATGAQELSPPDLLKALNALRVEGDQVYPVRDLNLRRDRFRIRLVEGKLAFLAPIAGRVTGAVFAGEGQIVFVPPGQMEKASVLRFTGQPILDEKFDHAYFRFTDSTAADWLEQMREVGAEPVADPAFADAWSNRAFHLHPPHSLRMMSTLLDSSPQNYFYAGLAGARLGPFDVVYDQAAGESSWVGQTRERDGKPYYDVWSLMPSREAPRAEPAFRSKRFEIETTIRPDRTMEGTTRVELEAREAGRRVVTFQLSRFLSVDEVRDTGGLTLYFLQNAGAEGRPNASQEDGALLVVLPQPTLQGQALSLAIHYRGSVIADVGNGVLFVGARGSWYPNFGLHDFSRYRMTFRYPARLRLVANGNRLDEQRQGDWKISRWESDGPVCVAGFNVGNYESFALKTRRLDIEVFANRALEPELAPKPQMIPPEVTRPYGRPGRISPFPPIIPPRPAAEPGSEAALERLARDVARSIGFYEELFGPFPYRRLAISQIPGRFGQGWPGLLYLSTFTFLAPEEQRRMGMTSSTAEFFFERVPLHETAHQWWGTLIGWKTYRDQWLIEALCVYAELMTMEKQDPERKQLSAWLSRYRTDLLAKVDGDQPAEAAGPLSLGHRLASSRSPQSYSVVVYEKGAWIFHMLREMMRDTEGSDRRFVQMIRALTDQFHYRLISTADLQKAVEKHMTPVMMVDGRRSMDWFFDQWVHATGIPQYRMQADTRAKGAAYQIRGKLVQEGVPETFTMPVPVYGELGGKLVKLGHVVTSGRETPFQFTTKSPPRRIVADPFGTILASMK